MITASQSDVGRVRTRNEDSYGEFSRSDGSTLLVIADGMGGHRAGATASRIAVETVGEVFAASDASPEATLRSALETANARVHEAALADPELRGMGTTAVALLIGPGDEGVVGHVGDSRLYRYRDARLRPLTRDHSVVAELERRGLLSADEAAVHPRRNEIMRSIGVDAHVEAEVRTIDLQPGDRYLLCSDGLSGLVDETEMAVILEEAPPDVAARRLVDRANEHGGTDNVTVQIVLLAEAPAARPEAEVAGAGKAGGAPARRGPRGRPDRRRTRRALMGIAIVLAAIAAGLLVWLARLQTRPDDAATPAPGPTAEAP